MDESKFENVLVSLVPKAATLTQRRSGFAIRDNSQLCNVHELT